MAKKGKTPAEVQAEAEARNEGNGEGSSFAGDDQKAAVQEQVRVNPATGTTQDTPETRPATSPATHVELLWSTVGRGSLTKNYGKLVETDPAWIARKSRVLYVPNQGLQGAPGGTYEYCADLADGTRVYRRDLPIQLVVR